MIMWVDQAEMPHLWQVIWFQLDKLEGDRLCKNQGEVWQYMGSKIEQDKLTHTFRHRCHPKSFNREYRHISTTLAGEVIE
jgi:hypothetical protein